MDLFIDRKTVVRDFVKLQLALERGCETTISMPRTGDADPFKRSACELPMSYYKANA